MVRVGSQRNRGRPDRVLGLGTSGTNAYKLPALRPHLLRAVVAGVLIASCSSPVCRPELVEQVGRCVPVEVTEKQCQPPCSATAHEVCDGDTELPSCICAPGYEGDPCTWKGVLDDPGFEDQAAWALSRGATVLPFERGSIDDGIAFFAPSVACNAGAVSQTVQMPSYEVGEPLVAEVTYRAQGLYGLSLGFDRAWTQLEATTDDAWRTERVCLGEAAYGGVVTVRLGSREQHFSCFTEPEGDIQVDRLDILLAEPGECPAPGEVLNGTGDEGGGGWQLETTGAAVAELAEGVGRGGTSAVRLAREGSERAVAWTTLSVPSSESLQSPALRFWWRGTSGLPFKFQIGRYDQIGGSGTGSHSLDDVFGTGSDVNYLYCLPPWTHGNVVELIFTTLVNGSLDPSELVIDDVEIVSDARCGVSTDVLDPGFEAGPTRIMGVTHWITHSQLAMATLRTEPSLSRTGDGVLELSYWNEEAILFLETWVLVPESNGEEGPAVVFWSNVPAFNEKPIRSVLGRAAVNPADLPVGGGWRRNEVCLFPEWSGRWFRFQWRLGDFAPIGTAPVEPPIRVYIDDLELTTSSACRAE
ncbi:MAG: hypothetical protein AMJ62_03545 [Myxococcales bacterium SG8_38]|nr:MAG: hypothetical protein AMJ62_03545 [Myxococcales bacterium SG8_38]